MQSKKCGFNYSDVKTIAKDFSDKVQLFEKMDIKELMKSLDVNIKEISVNDLNKSFFIKINQNKKYEMNIPIGLDEKQERFFMTQGLGHIVMHLDRNQKEDVYINNITQDESVQEALWFALEVLMPDDIVEKYLTSNNEVLSNLFRVPLGVVEMKRAIKNKQKNN